MCSAGTDLNFKALTELRNCAYQGTKFYNKLLIWVTLESSCSYLWRNNLCTTSWAKHKIAKNKAASELPKENNIVFSNGTGHRMIIKRPRNSKWNHKRNCADMDYIFHLTGSNIIPLGDLKTQYLSFALKSSNVRNPLSNLCKWAPMKFIEQVNSTLNTHKWTGRKTTNLATCHTAAT